MPGEQRLDRGNRGGDCSGDGLRQAFIELRRGRADGDPKRHRRAPIEPACEMMNQRTLPCHAGPQPRNGDIAGRHVDLGVDEHRQIDRGETFGQFRRQLMTADRIDPWASTNARATTGPTPPSPRSGLP